LIERPLLVNVVLFRLADETLQVLLASPVQAWELPGSELGSQEGLEHAAERAIAALLDRPKTYLEQLFTYGAENQAPVCVVYFAIIPAEAGLVPGKPVRWTPVWQAPSLAHEHAEILAYALRRLRYKLEYTAVGFQLLPAEFTLSELQHTYEIILDEKLDKRNFRRRMLQSGIIEVTSHLRTGEGRPARLYRYRPDAVAEVKARRLFP
jgi:8-oxo-dGTP diphosphatase